jgi:2-hydroxy-3-oxopropionate reductase
MARNLIAAGHRVIVLDRNPEPAAELAALGAQRAEAPAAVAAGSDLVITMLPDTPDVEEVVFGAQGVLAGLRPGRLYIDMSTVAPMLAQRIAEAGAARGFAVLDAPVSGGQAGAEKATLSIMVGGTEEAYQQALPVLQTLGKNIVHCGGPGAGQIVKACNQILVALTILGVAEALTLGAKAGVDPAKIVQVLGAGLARCGILETRGERMVAGDFAPGFRSRLHYKDLRIATAAGQAYEAPLPGTAVAHEMFKQMVISGRGDLDHTGLLDLLHEMARPAAPV